MTVNAKGNLLEWTSTGTPAVAGDLGLDTTSGTASVYESGSVQPLITQAALSPQLASTLASANAYAQSLTYNIASKEPAHVATAAPLPANTATTTLVLTANVNGALPLIDGESLAVGERIIVKNEVATANNGLYAVTSLGSAGSKWVLTRTPDADTAAELCGAMVPVDTGTQAGTVWLFSANQTTFVMGTTPVIWTQVTVPVATTLVAGTVILAGDIGGTYSSVTVTGLQGKAVSAAAPLSDQVLRWNGAAWAPATLSTAPLWVPIVAGQYDTTQTGATPLVIGSTYLDPTTFSGYTGCSFEAIGFVSNAAATCTAALWNVTDNALIATVTFTGTTSSFSSAAATSLASLGSAKIVEVRLSVSSASYSASVTMARLRFF